MQAGWPPSKPPSTGTAQHSHPLQAPFPLWKYTTPPAGRGCFPPNRGPLPSTPAPEWRWSPCPVFSSAACVGSACPLQHGTPEAPSSQPVPSATPKQGHTSALPWVSCSVSPGAGARSLTSGCSDHTAGRPWLRRVGAEGRLEVFSRWLENCGERREVKALAPSSPLLSQGPFLWSSGVGAASALPPC